MNTVSRNTSLHLVTLRPAVMRDFLRIISLSVGIAGQQHHNKAKRNAARQANAHA